MNPVLTHIALHVENLSECVRFYERYCGMTICHERNDPHASVAWLAEPGKEKEFIGYEKEYVEVLNRVENWVHFRNPHPTTPTMGSEFLNVFLGGAADATEKEMEKKYTEYALKEQVEGDWNDNKQQSYENFMNRKKEDWSSHEFLTLYMKEHIVLNDQTGIAGMYVPKRLYAQLGSQYI